MYSSWLVLNECRALTTIRAKPTDAIDQSEPTQVFCILHRGAMLTSSSNTTRGNTMTDEATNAKAEAKAAKARAKALRPWYKKKRFWALGIIGVIIIVSVTSQNGSDTTSSNNNSPSTNNLTSDTIGTGLGSSDATGDIDSIDCGTPDAIGVSYPTVKVTNRSSKASTYFITIVAESSDGSVLHDTTIISIMSLQPNQTTTEKGIFTKEIPSGSICKISEIQRTAS